MALKTATPASTPHPSAKCLVLSEGGNLPLAINFYCSDGRIFGFPYAHLVCWRYEKNPDAGLQPNAPADRLSLLYSAHDVVLLGWRLASLPALLQQARVVSVHSLAAKYFGLSDTAAFITEILVKDQKQEQE
jgi:hypothetical protein